MKAKRIVAIVAAILVVLVVGLWLSGKALSPWARTKFIAAIEDRFASKVEIQNLDLQLFPWFSAVGDKVVFRHKGRTDVPPLIEIKRFTASSSLPQLIFMRVNALTLEGLRVTVARDRNDDDDNDEAAGNDEDSKPDQPDQKVVANQERDDRDRSKPPTKEEEEGKGEGTDNGPGVVIETIYADGTHIEILPKKEGKQPLTFELSKLTLHGADGVPSLVEG